MEFRTRNIRAVRYEKVVHEGLTGRKEIEPSGWCLQVVSKLDGDPLEEIHLDDGEIRSAISILKKALEYNKAEKDAGKDKAAG